MAKSPNMGLEKGRLNNGSSDPGVHPIGGDDHGYSKKGILPVGSLASHTCDTRLGYRYAKMPSPDSLPVSGRYGNGGTDGDGPDGRSGGLGPDLPRSGRFSGSNDYGE